MNIESTAGKSVPVTPAPVALRPVSGQVPEASPAVVRVENRPIQAEPSGSVPAKEESPAQATQLEMERAAENLQRHVHVAAPELQFSVDEDSGRTVIKITDTATKEVIRQIPSEEVLRLNKELDRLKGTLLNQQA